VQALPKTLFSIKRCLVKRLLLLLPFFVLAGSLTADTMDPQWLLHAGGALAIDTAPDWYSGDTAVGGSAGFEWIPATFGKDLFGLSSPLVGFDLDYNYLSVGQNSLNQSEARNTPLATDNNVLASVRLLSPKAGLVTAYFQGGVGYNTSPNAINAHYLAFVEPGARLVLASRLALDAGLRYEAATPNYHLTQSIGVTLGISVPLDGSFNTAMATESAAVPAAPLATTPATATAPTAAPTAPPAGNAPATMAPAAAAPAAPSPPAPAVTPVVESSPAAK